MLKEGEKYRHFQGTIYEIVSIAEHTETNEKLVIYRNGENIWARPVSMFLDKNDISKRPDNITGQKYRFEKVEEKIW